LATDNTPSAASAVPAQGLVAAEAPAPEAAASAEDILKQAMANREQKHTEEPVSSTEVPPSPADKEALEADLEKKMAEAKKKAEEIEQAAKDKVEEVVASVPVPATIEPVVPAQPQTANEQPAAPVEAIVPEETKQEISANKEAVSALEGKLDTLLSRMDKIENDLNTVRESKGGNTQDLEKTVSSLKEEIAELRSRPAPSVASDVSDEPVTPKPSKKKRTVKAVSPENDAYSPNKPVASTAPSKPAGKSASTNGRWELRAAQPGRAWVSKAGERDMQAVSVGDTLPGIGRIGAITYMNGRWTVSGAQGSIQQ
jgi:intracellular multiplication protein IcmG